MRSAIQVIDPRFHRNQFRWFQNHSGPSLTLPDCAMKPCACAVRIHGTIGTIRKGGLCVGRPRVCVCTCGCARVHTSAYVRGSIGWFRWFHGSKLGQVHEITRLFLIISYGSNNGSNGSNEKAACFDAINYRNHWGSC